MKNDELTEMIEQRITNAVGEERDRILLEVSKIRQQGITNSITNDYLNGWHEACDRIRDAVR